MSIFSTANAARTIFYGGSTSKILADLTIPFKVTGTTSSRLSLSASQNYSTAFNLFRPSKLSLGFKCRNPMVNKTLTSIGDRKPPTLQPTVSDQKPNSLKPLSKTIAFERCDQMKSTA